MRVNVQLAFQLADQPSLGWLAQLAKSQCHLRRETTHVSEPKIKTTMNATIVPVPSSQFSKCPMVSCNHWGHLPRRRRPNPKV